MFRQEVLRRQASSVQEEIYVDNPIGAAAYVSAAVLVTGTLLAVLLLASYARRVTIDGEVVPARGLFSVTSPKTGVLRKLHVSAGHPVPKGAPLAEVGTGEAIAGLGETEIYVSGRIEAYRQLTVSAAAERASSIGSAIVSERKASALLGAQIEEVERQIAFKRTQISTNEALLRDLRSLLDRKYVSRLQVAETESSYLSQLADLSALQSRSLELRRQRADSDRSVQSLASDRTLARIEREKALIDIERDAASQLGQSSSLVLAPESARVSAVNARIGQSVRAGDQLLSLIPAGDRLIARFFIDSQAIGLLRIGDAVLLRFASFPYQKFGQKRAAISFISAAPVRLDDQGETTGPTYQVDVALPDGSFRTGEAVFDIRPGMQVQADVLLERRTLLEWLFEPVYGFGKRVSAAGSGSGSP